MKVRRVRLEDFYFKTVSDLVCEIKSCCFFLVLSSTGLLTIYPSKKFEVAVTLKLDVYMIPEEVQAAPD